MKSIDNDKKQTKNKRARLVLWVIFTAYCAALLWMLYFSRSYRHGYSINEYIREFSNFIPFHTVVHYLRIAALGSAEFVGLFLWNIGGNLIMLLPLGALLPCLFFKLDRLWKIALSVTGTVILIELAQLIFRVGVVDIDDLILNLAGAMIGYALLKIPALSGALRAADILPPRREKQDGRREKDKKKEERQCVTK